MKELVIEADRNNLLKDPLSVEKKEFELSR